MADNRPPESAILLAAGFGTRLRPMTESMPKCMVPINGEPLLGIWLDNLEASGVKRVLINTHYLSDVVTAYLDTRPSGLEIAVTYEPDLLGTAGTLRANLDFFGPGATLVAHADNLTWLDIPALKALHDDMVERFCAIASLLTFYSDNPTSAGIVETDADGMVRAFHEKVAHPPGNLANAAIYFFEPEVRDLIAAGLPDNAPDISRDLIPQLIPRLAALPPLSYLRDIGTPESYAMAQAEFAVIRQAHRGD